MGATSMTRALVACADTALASPAFGDARVGVDVVLVSDVRDSLAVFGDSYRDRVYTRAELADCAGDPARLAARFAAKEAVTKVLAPRDAPGWWRDIETVRSVSGACTIGLYGAAAACARARGLEGWGVSLTHEGDYAAAVVVARLTRTQGMTSDQEAVA